MYARNKNRQTALHFAARQGNVAMMRAILRLDKSAREKEEEEERLREMEEEEEEEEESGQQQQQHEQEGEEVKKKKREKKKKKKKKAKKKPLLEARDRWQRTALHWTVINSHLDG